MTQACSTKSPLSQRELPAPVLLESPPWQEEGAPSAGHAVVLSTHVATENKEFCASATVLCLIREEERSVFPSTSMW